MVPDKKYRILDSFLAFAFGIQKLSVEATGDHCCVRFVKEKHCVKKTNRDMEELNAVKQLFLNKDDVMNKADKGKEPLF